MFSNGSTAKERMRGGVRGKGSNCNVASNRKVEASDMMTRRVPLLETGGLMEDVIA
jgi:hypothetical protein